MTVSERAHNTLVVLAFLGVTLMVLGGIVVGTEYPHDVSLQGAPDHGSWGIAVAGGVVAGVGQLMLLVALVGWGVRLGIQAARTDATPAAAGGEDAATALVR